MAMVQHSLNGCARSYTAVDLFASCSALSAVVCRTKHIAGSRSEAVFMYMIHMHTWVPAGHPNVMWSLASSREQRPTHSVTRNAAVGMLFRESAELIFVDRIGPWREAHPITFYDLPLQWANSSAQKNCSRFRVILVADA
jgi:hypothetical protein